MSDPQTTTNGDADAEAGSDDGQDAPVDGPVDSPADVEALVPDQGPVERPELMSPPGAGGSGGPGAAVEERQSEAVEHPAKVMRIGSMIKLLLEEVRQSDLDEPSRDRLRDIYETSVHELSEALSPDLRDELGRLAHPFAGEAVPSEAELRVAKAQLVGWLEGLFHGIQATLFAQQMAARQQLEEMRRRLPPGATPAGPDMEQRPGTYL